MRKINLIPVFLCLFVFAKGQVVVNDTKVVKSMKEQADIMAKYLVNKDFKSFVKYTHPRIIEMVGGSEKMTEMMEKEFKSMEENGVKFKKVEIGLPGQILKVGDELQSVLTEAIQMQFPGETKNINGALLALSNDGGKNWFFVDVGGKDLSTIQKIFPSVSNELVFPK